MKKQMTKAQIKVYLAKKELEKLIFEKGYQLDWDEVEQKWIYDVEEIRIVLAIEPKL